MNKFHLGEVVRVIDTLPEDKSVFDKIFPFNEFNAARHSFCGQLVTIDVCLKKGYLIKEDGHIWLWREDMFVKEE